MNERKFLVHYKYDGMEYALVFNTTGKVNVETFRRLVRYWHGDRDKNLQTIIYSWSLIE